MGKSNNYINFQGEGYKMKNYDNFFLPANDLKKAKEFYQGILGLSIKFDFSDKGFLAFKVGDQEPASILKDTNIRLLNIALEIVVLNTKN
jgi:predicted enzyme related to lactoylglutathione lyase